MSKDNIRVEGNVFVGFWIQPGEIGGKDGRFIRMKLSILAATALCAALTSAAPAPGSHNQESRSGIKSSASERTGGPANTRSPSIPPHSSTIPPNAPPPQRQTRTRPAQVDPTQNPWKPQATKSWGRKYRHRRESEDLEDIDEDEEYLEERALLPTISFSIPFRHGGVKHSTTLSIPIPTSTKAPKPPAREQKEAHSTEGIEARSWSKAPLASSTAPPASKVTQPPSSSADAKKGSKKPPHTNTDPEAHGTSAHSPPKHTGKPKLVDREEDEDGDEDEDEDEEDLEARNAVGPVGVIPPLSHSFNRGKPTIVPTLLVFIPHPQQTGKGRIAQREVEPATFSAHPMPSVYPTIPTAPIRYSLSIKPSCTESSKFSKQSYVTSMQTKVKPTHHSHVSSYASHIVTTQTSVPVSPSTLPESSTAYEKRGPVFISQLMHTPTRVYVPVQHTTGPVRSPKIGARDLAQFEEENSLVEEITDEEDEPELEKRGVETVDFIEDDEESEFEERDLGDEENEETEEEPEEEPEEEEIVERAVQLEAVNEEDLEKREFVAEETEVTEEETEETEEEELIERDIEPETSVFEDEEWLEEESEE
ncbi:hypothetical protein BGZ60DRAFT_429915 [Tricladium varicosporioides]|nr:hypothetical protein BGZ60DRAFT_429915 [Hymenoscyphus varicosporioides]